jgi:hypothetical protein
VKLLHCGEVFCDPWGITDTQEAAALQLQLPPMGHAAHGHARIGDCYRVHPTQEHDLQLLAMQL